MSGKNHEGNKSPDIYDRNYQRRFQCSRAMKHEAMKAYEAQGASLEGSKEGRTPKCPKAEKLSMGATLEAGGGGEDMGFHWQIRQSLGATFKRRKDTKMSNGR
jgi:hypothetical protein